MTLVHVYAPSGIIVELYIDGKYVTRDQSTAIDRGGAWARFHLRNPLILDQIVKAKLILCSGRTLEAERRVTIPAPKPPEILRPQDNSVVEVRNTVFEWRDPGINTIARAVSYRLRIAQSGGSDINISGITSTSWTSNVLLDYDANYTCFVYATNSSGLETETNPGRVFKTVPRPTGGGGGGTGGGGGGTDPGVKEIHIFNCNVNNNSIHVWLRDRQSGNWDNKGQLEPQYENGVCPVSSSQPIKLTLEDNHVYDLVCVDTELSTCNGRNDPELENCRRFWQNGILGKTNGARFL